MYIHPDDFCVLQEGNVTVEMTFRSRLLNIVMERITTNLSTGWIDWWICYLHCHVGMLVPVQIRDKVRVPIRDRCPFRHGILLLSSLTVATCYFHALSLCSFHPRRVRHL
jgi:hypothetical protein